MVQHSIFLVYDPIVYVAYVGACGITNGHNKDFWRWFHTLLKGSWDLVSKVIIRTTPLRGLITPVISYLLSPMILQVWFRVQRLRDFSEVVTATSSVWEAVSSLGNYKFMLSRVLGFRV